MEREGASALFDTSVKNVHKFSFRTSEGNDVSGFINKSRRSRMGSLIIDEVNGKETYQYVTGMPKIQYLDGRDELTLPIVMDKADGTNIVQYPLMDHRGNVLEVCYKTRLMPQCQDKFMDLVDQCVTDGQIKAVEKEKVSLSYELYGYMNPHEVNYQVLDIPLRMDLITALKQGRSLPYEELQKLSYEYQICKLMRHWLVREHHGQYLFAPTYFMRERFGEFMDCNMSFFANGLREAYHELEKIYEKMNFNYQEKYQGGIITEGSVWHFTRDDENIMRKNKAISVREGHIKQACGIPAVEIRKALFKAKENGYDLEDRDNRGSLFEFVKGELSEENPAMMVEDQRTEQKFNSVLSQMTKKIAIDDQLKDIVSKINEECGEDTSPADKMRVFAEKYPDLRKMSSKVYQAIVSM